MKKYGGLVRFISILLMFGSVLLMIPQEIFAGTIADIYLGSMESIARGYYDAAGTNPWYASMSDASTKWTVKRAADGQSILTQSYYFDGALKTYNFVRSKDILGASYTVTSTSPQVDWVGTAVGSRIGVYYGTGLENVAMVVEEAGTDVYAIVGAFWTDAKRETFGKGCNDSGSVKTKVVDASFWAGFRISNYDGDIQADGDGVAHGVGFCAYRPYRMKDGWFPSDGSNKNTYEYLFAFTKFSLENGPITALVAPDDESFKPTQEQIDKCSVTFKPADKNQSWYDKPLSSYPEGSVEHNVLNNLKEEFLKGLDTDAATSFREMFPKDVLSPEDDQKYYNIYYRDRGTTAHNYPDRIVDPILVSDYLALYSSSNMSAEIGKYYAGIGTIKDGVTGFVEYPAGTLIGIGAVKGAAAGISTAFAGSSAASAAGATEAAALAAAAANTSTGTVILTTATGGATTGAVTGSAFGAAAAAFLTPVVIIAIVALIVILAISWWINSHKNDAILAAMKAGYTLLLAFEYISANRLYQKCTGTWENNGGIQEDAYKQIRLLKIEGVANAQAALNDMFNNRCGTMPGLLNIGARMAFSFCSLGVMLEKFAIGFWQNAVELLIQTIGWSYLHDPPGPKYEYG